MFQYRTDSFAPSVNAIQNHLGAVEKELEKIGRIAGRRPAAASAAGARIGETIAAAQGCGSDTLDRNSAHMEDRPLITVGVALGIGILIGAAVLGGAAARK